MTDKPNTCPNCSADLDGDLIWQTFMDVYQDEAKADEAAERHGGTRTEGRWERQIGLYSDKHYWLVDRWCCPDCGHIWEANDPAPIPAR